MNFKLALKNFRNTFRKSIPLVISGFIGATIALFSYPLQKEIDQYYWNKQNSVLINQNIIEKRLDILDDFIEEFTKYNWCSIRAGVINITDIVEEEPLVCYHNASARLMGLALKAKYYYDEEVINELDNFAILIKKYEDDIKNGDVESESSKLLNNSAMKIISLMQETMLKKFE